MLRCATFLATCLAIALALSWGWELFSNRVQGVLIRRRTGILRDKLQEGCHTVQCLKMPCGNRCEMYNLQYFMQQKCCMTDFTIGMHVIIVTPCYFACNLCRH